jgi:hypothetical protein
VELVGKADVEEGVLGEWVDVEEGKRAFCVKDGDREMHRRLEARDGEGRVCLQAFELRASSFEDENDSLSSHHRPSAGKKAPSLKKEGKPNPKRFPWYQ